MSFLPAACLVLPSLSLGNEAKQMPALLDLQRGNERFQIDLDSFEGYRMAAYLLRDIRSGQQGFPDPDLLRLAAWSQAVMAQSVAYTAFRVTSGLRTRQTNQGIEGAARNSRHLPDEQGRFFAMDVEPVGSQVEQLATALVRAGFGGVGVYERHVHFDVRETPVLWRKTRLPW
ncbi:MAG: D-Ala-D-Ala carboxypeptidase family metallohydrolase [Burkholderiales bacterium]|nr:D-Ala-D-Ala carboxypeptidase family metallohydrolase [Burkholderiales bacterium]